MEVVLHFTRQNMRKFNGLTPFRSYGLEYSLVYEIQLAMSTPAAVTQPQSASKEPHRMRITAGGSIRHYVAFALASLRVSHVNLIDLFSV